MLMAAGLGTRLRPFTERIPKPLIPVMGVPCAEFALQALHAAGVHQVVANLHHLADETARGLRTMLPTVQFSDETAELLGSGGGIRTALSILDAMSGGGSFFILNADTLCSLDLRELAATHQRLRSSHGVTMTLALLQREAPGEEQYREVLVNESGDRILGLGSKTRTGGMYVGCAILEREAVVHLNSGVPLDFVRDILQPAIDRGTAGAHQFSGIWLDVGSPELWWRTHLELIERYENGALPREWARLLEERNRRLAGGAWCAKSAPLVQVPTGWTSPCYWDGSGQAPSRLGPDAVLYGEPTAGSVGSGVGADGLWVALQRSK
jgi:NDP-sugar pyrophosphorylase family protein